MSIIITGAAAGLFFMKTSPVLDHVAQLEKTRMAYYNAEQSNAEFQNLLKEKNDIFIRISDSNIKFLDELLPDSIDNVKLIIDINQIASNNGMTIKNISIKGNDNSAIGPDSRPYGIATLGFSVSGPYETFQKFLAALETSFRIIDVTSLSFSAGDKNQYDFNLEVKSYWLKQK